MIFRKAFFAAIGLTLAVGCSVNPPTITITEPEDGASVDGVVSIRIVADIDRGKVETPFKYYIDDSLHLWGLSYHYEWDTELLPDSSYHTIIVIGYDKDGNAGADTVEVQIVRDEGELKWRYKIGDGVHGDPAVGLDGTIYAGSDDGNLYALNPDGTLKWKYPTLDCTVDYPFLGPYCDIYVEADSVLFAISFVSGYKWDFKMDNSNLGTYALASDGTIYVGVSNQPAQYLYALNSDGSVKWSCELDDWTGFFLQWACVPAVGMDGTIYVGSDNNYLYAVSPEGVIQWRFETSDGIHTHPAIDSDGTIYIGTEDYYLYAVNPDGTLKWRYQVTDTIHAGPIIGLDATIYVGSRDGYFYAVNSDGTLKWSYQTDAFISGSTPAVASDGTIYVGASEHLYAINSDGTLKWRYKTGSALLTSPAVAPDGTIYIGDNFGYLYAINGSAPLADTPWPMFCHDLRHTSRARAQ